MEKLIVFHAYINNENKKHNSWHKLKLLVYYCCRKFILSCLQFRFSSYSWRYIIHMAVYKQFTINFNSIRRQKFNVRINIYQGSSCTKLLTFKGNNINNLLKVFFGFKPPNFIVISYCKKWGLNLLKPPPGTTEVRPESQTLFWTFYKLWLIEQHKGVKRRLDLFTVFIVAKISYLPLVIN